MEIECLKCKKKFKTHPSSNRKYCSSECNRKSMIGRKLSKDTKRKMSLSQKGKKRIIKNKKPHSEETKRKIGQANKKSQLGKKTKQTTREKMSKSQKRINNKPPVMEKEKHWNWQGGITKEMTKIRRSKKYREWREEVLKRDGYKCVFCGEKDDELHADHIKPFAYLINQIRDIYGNLIYEQISEFKELWSLENGRTLCMNCHRKTKSYKNIKNAIKGVN